MLTVSTTPPPAFAALECCCKHTRYAALVRTHIYTHIHTFLYQDSILNKTIRSYGGGEIVGAWARGREGARDRGGEREGGEGGREGDRDRDLGSGGGRGRCADRGRQRKG